MNIKEYHEIEKLRMVIRRLIQECEYNADYHHITPKLVLDNARELINERVESIEPRNVTRTEKK